MNNIVDFKKPKLQRPNNKQPKHPPMINLPIVTKILIITMIVIFAAIYFMDDAMKAFIYLNFGFIPSIWTGQNAYGMDTYAFLSPITYIFLHGNFMHVAMNCAMLMAFGAGVEQWMGAKRFLLFFIACGFAAIIVETIIHPFSTNPVIGASGSLSGLFAAILILLQARGQLPTGKYGIWPFAAFWIGLSLVFGLIGGVMTGGGQIAWAAHLGGFIGGFILLKFKYFTSNPF